MRVVLHYQGPMGKGDKNELMHSIRSQIHPQLRRLWETDESLMDVAKEVHIVMEGEHLGFVRNEADKGWVAYPNGGHSAGEFIDEENARIYVIKRWFGYPGATLSASGAVSYMGGLDSDFPWEKVEYLNGAEHLGRQFTKSPFEFIPLVTKRLHLMCHLSIKLYRQGEPGSIIGNKGDLDNKLKRIIDALRVPSVDQLKPGKGDAFKPEPSQSPFYCLLEDDALVSGIEIRTERWFPTDPDAVTEHEVRAIVEAVIRPTKVTDSNRGLLADYL